jgi:serine/threonine protein kinase
VLIYWGFTGTFARVWLVRLANPKEEDRDKVFALKVLRKVEGSHQSYSRRAIRCFANVCAVIKLKQVDHVNHERSVLADVAGHPFITALITSFSDHDSLYMLVSFPPSSNDKILTRYDSSSTTAPAAKSSPTYEKQNASTKTPRASTPPKSCSSSNSCTSARASHTEI